MAKRGFNNCKLTEEQVVEILQSKAPTAELARLYKVNPATMRGIRIGRSWSHVRPDLPRVKSVAVFNEPKYCTQCIHRIHGKCSMGFPESAKHPKFAELCSIYATKPSTHDWRDMAFEAA